MKYSFPKVDLHLHLDGSFRPSTIWELVQKQGVQMPADTLEGYEAWMEKCSHSGSVNEYLKMFDAPLQVMQDQESLARITKELIEDIAKQGVVYAEIRFAPQLHTTQSVLHTCQKEMLRPPDCCHRISCRRKDVPRRRPESASKEQNSSRWPAWRHSPIPNPRPRVPRDFISHEIIDFSRQIYANFSFYHNFFVTLRP